jgi:hypothetical protein
MVILSISYVWLPDSVVKLPKSLSQDFQNFLAPPAKPKRAMRVVLFLSFPPIGALSPIKVHSR